MTGRCDEVEQGMDTVIAEAGVTLDTRLLSENVIVLALEVANDLLETVGKENAQGTGCSDRRDGTYANSLSMLSPKPGVSTMVRAMRTPSSSSSAQSLSRGDV